MFVVRQEHSFQIYLDEVHIIEGFVTAVCCIVCCSFHVNLCDSAGLRSVCPGSFV